MRQSSRMRFEKDQRRFQEVAEPEINVKAIVRQGLSNYLLTSCFSKFATQSMGFNLMATFPPAKQTTPYRAIV